MGGAWMRRSENRWNVHACKASENRWLDQILFLYIDLFHKKPQSLNRWSAFPYLRA